MSSPKYATVLRLEGVEQVLRNINVASEKMGRAAERGCIAGAKFLRNESLKLVPVQLGALRSSCYKPKNIGGRGFKADIVIGYTADYAVWVHEDLVAQAPPARAAHGKFFNIKHAAEIAAAKGKAAGTAKGGMFNRGSLEQAKFLEQPLRDKRKEILQIIANVIKQAAGTAKGGMFNRGSLEQAKFLEQPLRDKRKEILQIIANAIKQAK